MIMLLIMTGVALAYASVSNATRTIETRREQAVIARLAFDGATLKAAYDSGLGTVSYPSTQVEVVGPYSCAVAIADNSSNLSHSLSLSSTLTLFNRTYSDTRITALKMPASQFFYCLAADSNTSLGSDIITGASGANGDVYCTGALQLSRPDTVNGDVEATSTVTQNGATATGLVSNNVFPIPLPAPVAGNYSSVASFNLLNILFGILLSGETFVTPYEVVYCNGNTQINGTFTGKGVLYVNGNLTVNGNMTYLSASDEVAIIVSGNVNFSGGVSNIVGYWYCGGTFSATSNLTLTRGCIVANTLTTSGNLTANYDPTIWNTPGEAYRMKLPGFWP